MHKEYNYDSDSEKFRIVLFAKYLRKNTEKKSQVKVPNYFVCFLGGGVN